MLSQQVLPSEANDDSLDNSLSSLVISFMETVSNGQTPLSLTSDNVKVVVSRSLAADIFNSTIAVGDGGTSISFATEEAANQCATSNGYVRLAMSSYSKNPYQATAEAPSKILRSQIFPNTTLAAASSSSSNSESPSFYITLPFYQTQTFVKTISLESLQFNETLPECTLYEDGELVSCDGCLVDHYTNDTVVFACYDVSLICGEGNAASTRRSRRSSRRLFSLSGDDDSQQALSTPTATTSQFAAIITNTAKSFALVLSANPFAVNIETAKPIIAFIGSLIMAIILGAFYFAAWDSEDYQQVLVYARPQDLEMKKQVSKIDMQSARQDRRKKRVIEALLHSSPRSRRKLASSASPIRSPLPSSSHSPSKSPTASVRNMSRKQSSMMQTKSFRFRSKSSANFMLLSENPMKTKSTRIMTTKKQQQLKRRQSALIVERKVDFTAERKAIAAFLEQTIPMTFSEGNFSLSFNRFLDTLLHTHSLSAMFFGASMSNTRLNRWFDLCVKLLLTLFLDTLFFGTFFADNGKCQGLVEEVSCESEINTATGYPYCSWNGAAINVDGTTVYSTSSCVVNRPPNDLTYTLIIALLCFAIALPIDLTLDYIRLEICSRRPDLSIFNVNSSYYLGSAVHDILSLNGMSVLDRALGNSAQQVTATPTRDSTIDLEAATNYSNNVNNNLDIDAEKVYHNFVPLGVEVREILSELRSLAMGTVKAATLPWWPGLENEEEREADDAILNYDFIERLVGLRIDGSPVRLTLMQRLRYHSQTQRLEHHLLKARLASKRIEQTLHAMPAVVVDDLNTALLQFFVLEQFSAMKRYVLRYQYFSFERVQREAINPFIWLGGWALLIGSVLFFIYWIYAWCLASGGAVFNAWAVNFVLVLVQELVILQVGQVLVIYFIATQSIEPQLMAIKKVLYSLAVNVLTENKTMQARNSSKGSDGEEKETDKANNKRSSSAGCSAIIQHLSPACRASSTHHLQGLSAARILRSIKDHDIVRCRDRNEKRLYFLALYFIALPVLFAFFGDAIGRLVLNAVLPSTAYLFIIANYQLQQVSPFVFIALYLSLVLFYIYKFLAIKPAVRKLKQKTEVSKSHRTEQKIQRAVERSTSGLYRFITAPLRLAVWVIRSLPRQFIDRMLYRTARKNMLRDRLWRNINRPKLLQCSIIPLHQRQQLLASTIHYCDDDFVVTKAEISVAFASRSNEYSW